MADQLAELPRWSTRALNAEHLTGFLNSGREDIDRWFADKALRLQEEAFARTFVWADQPPYVSAFYTLVPHRVESDDDHQISGHAGGALSGYLIAKIGIHQKAAADHSLFPGSSNDTLPNVYLLIIDAVVRATHASYFAGGRYIFIDLNNEPQYLVDAAREIGFKSISPTGSTMHVAKVRRPPTANPGPQALEI